MNKVADSIRFCVVSLILLVAMSCAGTEPEPIAYGHDNCEYCKMTIVDKSFGCELVTAKGKKLKFDSVECLAAFESTGKFSTDEIAGMWVTDYGNPEKLIRQSEATFVHSGGIRSPMGMGLAAFASADAAEKFSDLASGEILGWEELSQKVEEAWHSEGE